MVASSITIQPVYLDGRSQNVLGGGVSSLDDDSVAHEADSKTVSTTARSERVLRNWQLSWSVAAPFITTLFRICRNLTGFLFISPLEEERKLTAMPARNTMIGSNFGDGTTTTFQLQDVVSLAYSIGVGNAASTAYDVNYPLTGTVIGYVNGAAHTVSNVNLLTGVITFASPPGNGLPVTADFERAFPVRFTSNSISRTLLQTDQTEVRSAQIAEIP